MKRVSIVITAYVPESKRYLDLCMKSVANLSYDNFEVIIVGKKGYLPEYPNAKTVAPPQETFWNSTGLNYGISQADPDSQYYFLLNDDTILTRDSLLRLVEIADVNPLLGQLMPYGNDCQGRYFAHCGLMPRPYVYEELEPLADQLIKQESAYTEALIFCDTLCTYAVLIPKKTFEKVGQYDESLLGHDDVDYSRRVIRAGFLNAICMSSLVYHFGGASVVHTLNPEKRSIGAEIYRKKWEAL